MKRACDGLAGGGAAAGGEARRAAGGEAASAVGAGAVGAASGSAGSADVAASDVADGAGSVMKGAEGGVREVLVTGAGGFVGSALVKALLQRGDVRVRAFSRGIGDLREVSDSLCEETSAERRVVVSELEETPGGVVGAVSSHDSSQDSLHDSFSNSCNESCDELQPDSSSTLRSDLPGIVASGIVASGITSSDEAAPGAVSSGVSASCAVAPGATPSGVIAPGLPASGAASSGVTSSGITVPGVVSPGITTSSVAEPGITALTGDFTQIRDFRPLVRGCDTVFHLISTTAPASSMHDVPEGIADNLVQTARLLDACVAEGVERFVFLSSGGTVYGSLATDASPASVPSAVRADAGLADAGLADVDEENVSRETFVRENLANAVSTALVSDAPIDPVSFASSLATDASPASVPSAVRADADLADADEENVSRETFVRENVANAVSAAPAASVSDVSTSAIASHREDDPLAPASPYGFQKAAIEQLLELYRLMYGLDYRVARLANAYGPGQDPAKGVGVVTTFVWRALNGQPLRIFGDGEVVRDYIYIDDVVCGLLNIAEYLGPERVFNLGSGVGVSVSEIARLVREIVNPDCSVEFLPDRSCDVHATCLDMALYRSRFGEPCRISLEEGIRLTADFLRRV